MPETPTKSYKVNNEVYDIAESDVAEFLQDMPDAQEVSSFIVGKDTFDIPIGKEQDFLADMPDAKLLKKKDETLSAPSYPTGLDESGQPSPSGSPSPSPSDATSNQIPEYQLTMGDMAPGGLAANMAKEPPKPQINDLIAAERPVYTVAPTDANSSRKSAVPNPKKTKEDVLLSITKDNFLHDPLFSTSENKDENKESYFNSLEKRGVNTKSLRREMAFYETATDVAQIIAAPVTTGLSSIGGGADKIAKTGEKYQQYIKEGDEPQWALLKTYISGLAGVAEVGIGALNAIPAVAGFTAALKTMEVSDNEEYTKIIQPVTWAVEEGFKKFGKEVPEWVHDLSLLGDLVVGGATFHYGTKYGKKAIEAGKSRTQPPTVVDWQAEMPEILETLKDPATAEAIAVTGGDPELVPLVKKQIEIEKDLPAIENPEIKAAAEQEHSAINEQINNVIESKTVPEMEAAKIETEIKALEKEMEGKSDDVKKLYQDRIDELTQKQPEPVPEVKAAETISFETVKKGDIVLHNGKEATVIGMKKSRGGNDVIEVSVNTKKTKKEIENDIWNEIAKRHSKDYPKGITLADAKNNHPGEWEILKSEYERLEESKADEIYTIDKAQWEAEVKNKSDQPVTPIKEPEGKPVVEAVDDARVPDEIPLSEGEVIEIPIRQELVDAMKEEAQAKNARAEQALRDQVNDENNRRIKEEAESEPPPPETPKVEPEGTGGTVDFIHAGTKRKGSITQEKDGRTYIKTDDGITYNVKSSDIIQKGESYDQAIARIGKKKKSESGQQEKKYEQSIGMTPQTTPGRIPIDPIIGGQTKQISTILREAIDKLKQRVFNVMPGKRAAGTYSPGSSAIKIKYSGDLDVTAHEIGHALDDRHAVLKTTTPEIDAELTKFWDYGSKPDKKLSAADQLKYKKGEGFAEWLRAYIVNPAEAILQAPKLYESYKSKVSAADQKAIESFSNDVRTFAGSTGRDMTLANIELDPKKEGIISKLLNREKNNEFTITFADKLAANYIDPMQAFNKAIEYAKEEKGIETLLPEKDPRLLARLLLGVEGKLTDAMENGLRDSKGELIKDADGNPKNLNWLLEPLLNTDEAVIKREMADVIAYMVSERAIELSQKLGKADESGNIISKENFLTGVGGGIFKDLDIAKKTLDEFNNGDANKLERIKLAAERYRDFADETLQYMVSKGRLSKKQYDLIKSTNTQYVALQRIMEAAPEQEISVFKGSSNALGSKKETIYKIEGSTRKITNPYIALLDSYQKSIKEADRNAILQGFRDLLTSDRDIHEGAPNRLSDIGVIAKAGDKNTITIFVDGKAEHWLFQKDIYEYLSGIDKEGYKLPGVVTALPRMLRWSVTHFPVFAARNLVRDTQDRLIKSDNAKLKKFRGVTDFFGKKKDFSDMASSGGLNAGHYFKDHTHYNGLLKEAVHDLSKNKKAIILDPIKLKQYGNKYFDLLQKSETANRIAEYRGAYRVAIEKGMDNYNASLYAAYHSRNLMDFALMGNHMRIVNQVIPFSNAAVRGIHRSFQSAKDNPAGFMARTAVWSLTPTVALWLWNNKTAEDREEYGELPAYQRDMFWNYKIGKNNWLSIPKPYELSLLGAGLDRGLSQAFGGDKKAFEGFGGTVAKNLMPVGRDNIAGPLQVGVELETNYDFFRDKNIIPPHEVDLDVSLRKTERGSRLGQSVQTMVGMDARQVDHLVNHQFSYFGNFATKVSDTGREGKGLGIVDLGFFKQSPAYNSKSVQDFMEYAKTWKQTTSGAYRVFSDLVETYFDATNNEQRDEIAKRLRIFAKNNLELWEKNKTGQVKAPPVKPTKTFTPFFSSPVQ